MVRAAPAALVLVATLALGGCAGWFFQPRAAHVRTPADFALRYEDVYLEASDGVRTHAWLVRPDVEPVGRVLFLHGNAQNVSNHLPGALWWVAEGHEVLALDYRGYGLSDGEPDVDGALLDVAAALRFLAARGANDALPTHVFGQSLGASLATLALAAYPAAGADVDALVLEAGFAGFARIGAEAASRAWLTWPLQWLPRLTLAHLPDPVDAIDEVGVPVVVVHSVDDRIVGVEHGRDLYAAARPPKRFVEARGRHIAAAADPAVRAAVLEFVRGASALQGPRTTSGTGSGGGS